MTQQVHVTFPQVEIITNNRVTTCRLQVMGIDGIGSAIRHEDDDDDLVIGENLAIGRALIDAGKKMTRMGHKRSNRKARE